MYPPIHIPAGAEYNASMVLSHMLDRGLKAPAKLTQTCRGIASVVLAKFDVADKRILRCLTNRLVSLSLGHE